MPFFKVTRVYEQRRWTIVEAKDSVEAKVKTDPALTDAQAIVEFGDDTIENGPWIRTDVEDVSDKLKRRLDRVRRIRRKDEGR